MKLSTLKRGIAAAVAVVIVVGLAWAMGFRMGASHTAHARDCGECHDDEREGWEKGVPE